MKKTAIFKAIMALFVIMLGVNFNADAQIGKNLLDKATDAAKGAGEGAIKQKWEIIVFSAAKEVCQKISLRLKFFI